jgi:hypothetical protein
VQQQDAGLGGDVKFPNLVWAIRFQRLAHYQLATRVGMEPSRFSRCLTGRFDFAPHERTRISELLSIDESWLFLQPAPRPLTIKGRPAVTTSGVQRFDTVEK